LSRKIRNLSLAFTLCGLVFGVLASCILFFPSLSQLFPYPPGEKELVIGYEELTKPTYFKEKIKASYGYVPATIGIVSKNEAGFKELLNLFSERKVIPSDWLEKVDSIRILEAQVIIGKVVATSLENVVLCDEEELKHDIVNASKTFYPIGFRFELESWYHSKMLEFRTVKALILIVLATIFQAVAAVLSHTRKLTS